MEYPGHAGPPYQPFLIEKKAAPRDAKSVHFQGTYRN
jgi:hypothetical protein